MRLSRARLLRARRSARRQRSSTLVKGPPASGFFSSGLFRVSVLSDRAGGVADGEEGGDGAVADVFDVGEAKADAETAIGQGFDAEGALGAVDVGLEEGDAEVGAFGGGEADAVVVVGGGAEDGGHVGDGKMRLHVGGLVGDGAVADGVGLVEGVAGERFDEVEDGVGVVGAVAEAGGAFDEAAAFGLHDGGDFLAHRFAHDVGLAEGVAAKFLGDFEDLVLVDDDAVGVVEEVGEVGMGVADRFVAVAGGDEAGMCSMGPGR